MSPLRWARATVFRQVYLTMLAMIFACAVCAGAAARWVHGSDRTVPTPLTKSMHWLADVVTSEGTAHSLERTGAQLGLDLTVFARDGEVLDHVGPTLPFPERAADSASWYPTRPGWGVAVRLGDGRVFAVAYRDDHGPEDFLRHLAALSFGLLLVAVAAYPVARRLTARLGRLSEVITRWGRGDLQARVHDESEDEVGALARGFDRSADQVSALLDAERRLMASASHELRSPLARIRMTLELCPGADDDPRIRAAIGDVEELDALVGDLLIAGRSRATVMPADQGLVDLRAIVDGECARVGLTARTEPSSIRGDAPMLRRLVRNLIENARKHGAPPIEVVLDAAGPRLSVRDHGAGVEEGQEERIFEAFHRGAGHHEGKDGGVGLGLALVRDLARWHGAEVRCTRPEGGGAAFVVEFHLGGLPRGP